MNATDGVADQSLSDRVSTATSAPYDWICLLSTTGPDHDEAVAQLHGLMLRAARHQVALMYSALPSLGSVRIDEIVHESADDATVAALAKLDSFEGRSQFTTWAYKFGILHAAVAIRRNMWKHRESNLDVLPESPATGASPEALIEAIDLSNALRAAITNSLSERQRTVVTAIIIDDVPIDILADQLNATRNAIYKTLYDARARLRAVLVGSGYLTTSTCTEVNS
jgi:RNA polymerase sigma-70 factor, ECF subfamily